MGLTQEQRNELAVKVAKLLNRSKPKTDIFDCLDIIGNLEECFIKELEHNINTKAGGE